MFTVAGFLRFMALRPGQSPQELERYCAHMRAGGGLFGHFESTAKKKYSILALIELAPPFGDFPVICREGLCECIPDEYRGDDTVPLKPHVVKRMKAHWRTVVLPSMSG